MTHIHLIGIGTGNPRHLTREAEDAITAADLILIPRKGAGKSDLADLRTTIVAALRDPAPVAYFDMPTRNPDLPYLDAVDAWHDEIAGIWIDTIAQYGGPAHVALLVWGDPSLYDSTLRIAARLDPAPELTVVAGITSVQALTAAHAIPLNTLNAPVTISTGRRLRDHGWPSATETLVIMLDGECAFQTLPKGEFNIWWGAYLGMENQIILSGPLDRVCDEIIETRTAARFAHGWIMDTYLLRRK